MHHKENDKKPTDGSQKQYRRGPSSFSMQDPEIIFEAIELSPGQTFADLGCGPGDYALAAAAKVEARGTVLALDRWQAMIEDLAHKVEDQGLGNVKTAVADLTKGLPLPDASVDVCFMATVMHSLKLKKDGQTIFSEMHRILKPTGRAAILNCKKEEQPWGPSLQQRLSPQQVEAWMTPHGFKTMGVVDLGFNYLIQFRPE